MCLNPRSPGPVQSSSIPVAATSLLLACSFLMCPSNCSQRDSKKLTNLRLSRVLKLLYKIQTLHSGLEGPSPQGPCWHPLCPRQEGGTSGGKPPLESLDSMQSWRPTLLELKTICSNTKGDIKERARHPAKKGRD